MALDITSPSFEDGDTLPTKYTAEGENISPSFEVFGIPEDTISLVMLMVNQDHEDGEFVHWLVWGIEPSLEELDEGEAPANSIEGYNDFGNDRYDGPMRQSNKNKYQFRLYALDIDLDELDEDATRTMIEKQIAGHILDEASITVSF